jgi:hypothetical protein
VQRVEGEDMTHQCEGKCLYDEERCIEFEDCLRAKAHTAITTLSIILACPKASSQLIYAIADLKNIAERHEGSK